MPETLDTRNVADGERLASVALAAALVTWGYRSRGAGGFAAVLAGGALALRGATGSCPVYSALGMSTGSADAVLGGPGGGADREAVR